MLRHNKGRTALITGGSGSVGTELVRAFAKSGYQVTFQYRRNTSRARRLESETGAKGLRQDFEKSLNLPRKDFSVIVNNAALNISDVTTHKVTLSDWHRTMRVNLEAPFAIVRQCLPYMIRTKWGRIINISSIYGLRAVPERLPYTVTKHGLSGFTKTVAKEYAEYGITCNEICPGPIESEMMLRIAKRSAKKDGGTPARYLKEVCEEIPAGRMLRPAELAQLALFLASDDAGYVTGASIPLDGGMIA